MSTLRKVLEKLESVNDRIDKNFNRWRSEELEQLTKELKEYIKKQESNNLITVDKLLDAMVVIAREANGEVATHYAKEKAKQILIQ